MFGQSPNVPAIATGERPATLPAGNPPTQIGAYANMSADAADALLSIAAAVHALAHATHQRGPTKPDEQVEFEVDASLLPAGGLSVKLPSGCGIGSYYVENNSSNTLTLYAGASPAARPLNSIGASTYRVMLCPEHVTSITVTSSGPALGLVRIFISTARFGPAMGSTIGQAVAQVSNTASPTSANITAVSSTVLPANVARIGAFLYSTGATALLGLGFVPTSTLYSLPLVSGAYFELPVNFKGAINAITASGSATVLTTEFS